MLTIQAIRESQARIAPHIRRTPLLSAQPLKESRASTGALYLKLENLQVTGSFKARGATNKVLSLPPEALARGIVTASGGNHGLGVAYAGWLAHTPATIFLPFNTPPAKAAKLKQWGARVVFEGQVWDDANRAARTYAERERVTYIHPFADGEVIAGQGTIALEILEDAPEMDVLLVAIGGGGLISGVSIAAKALRPTIRIIGVEPTGAPTLYESVRAGRVITLEEIRTAANTLAPLASAQLNLDIIRANVDEILLVTDEEMRDAARWLWFEMGIAAELSGAAAVAALLAEKVRVEPSQRVCALVCGAGTDGIG